MRNTVSGTIPVIVPTHDSTTAAIARLCSNVAMRKLRTVIGAAVEQTRSVQDLLEILTSEAHPF